MKLILTRLDLKKDGIFSTLVDENKTISFNTLEHSYLTWAQRYSPKIASGTYTCKRGMHRLEHMTSDFETFEILGIPDFMGKDVTKVLFHWGNYNEDSEGCVLLGRRKLFPPDSPKSMITDSRDSFKAFMDMLVGVNEFTLEVV